MTANKTAAPVRISEFMDRDFKLFSLYDNLRSIPYLTDGFKPSQRKAVCGMLMRGENAPEIKVSQLTGTVSACVSGDTLVLLASGEQIEIAELAKRFDDDPDYQIELMTYNTMSNISEPNACEMAWKTKEVDELIELELETGELIRLTGDHVVFTDCGEVRADKLTVEHRILSL